jgi:hypothetical protein
MCPHTRFKEDLISQLKKWRKEGDRLIVCLDANEDIYKKAIRKSLTNINGLAMKEVVGKFTCTPIGTTFFRRSKPIDGVWATSDIMVCNVTIMPAGYGIGDHQLFVIDFVSSNIIGTTPPKVVRASSRQLNTKIPWVAAEYARILEEKIIQHRLIERISEAHTNSKSKRSLTHQLNRLDKELGHYMQHMEKKCHKIKSVRIPFSLKLSL